MKQRNKLRVAGLVAVVMCASALFGQTFVTRKWDDASIPDAASFAAGNKLMGLNGSVVTRFSRSVFDALYALKSRAINTTAPLSGGGDLSADRTLTVATATTSAVGVVELATDGEDAADKVVQGNDARMDNARTPTTHASSHFVGGSDPLLVFSPYGDYDPYNPPATNFSIDTWASGADTISWRDTNFGSSTKTYKAGSLIVDSDSGASTQMRIRYMTLPAAGTDWTITVRQSAVLGNASDSAGIVVLCGGTEGTPTCVEAVVFDSTSSSGRRLIHFTDSNYDTAAGTSSRGSFTMSTLDPTKDHCLQFRYTGASTDLLESYFSWDCRAFSFVGSTTLGADPASAGLLTLDDAVVYFDTYLVRTDADRNLPGE